MLLKFYYFFLVDHISWIECVVKYLYTDRVSQTLCYTLSWAKCLKVNKPQIKKAGYTAESNLLQIIQLIRAHKHTSSWFHHFKKGNITIQLCTQITKVWQSPKLLTPTLTNKPSMKLWSKPKAEKSGLLFAICKVTPNLV